MTRVQCLAALLALSIFDFCLAQQVQSAKQPPSSATAMPQQRRCLQACEEERNRGINPDFKRVPPIPEKATVEILKPESKQQNADLILTFGKGQKLGRVERKQRDPCFPRTAAR